ncbi:MAG: threonine synthase [Oscillospiraceae bacterium]|nr:threonine synthase [Oscillospiraceae bacterium]
MLYVSTRGGGEKLLSSEAIIKGLSDDGGLYVPEHFPQITLDVINLLAAKPYSQRAAYILGVYLGDFTPEELESQTDAAYNSGGFAVPEVAPLRKVSDDTFFLELWHGPTSAFKDMALQILPRLLTSSLRKTNESKEVCILVATSGDTGKAALEGFRDVPGTRVMVFYPRDGVSDVQKLQMTSQQGSNVNVVAVEGNFDDAQNGVKEIFTDEFLKEWAREKGFFLSSANSINWGRLVPQIAYYVSAYCDLLNSKEIQLGDKIDFCVPTGNFGNILAAYYALRMGLPINRLILASNQNDVLSDFINTGVYDRNRQFYTTVSPSMDILISSNLERLLFELSGKNGEIVSGLMSELSKNGRYELSSDMRDALANIFSAGRCSEEETLECIAKAFKEQDYLIDTHTAVAYNVLQKYRDGNNQQQPCVVVSTASPYKFSESVLIALGQETIGNGADLIDSLFNFSKSPVPMPLSGIRNAVPRFEKSVAVADMQAAVREFLQS